MIIELTGLPGGGKTTLSKAMEARGAVRVQTPSPARLAFGSFIFWLSRPLLAARLFVFMMARAPRNLRYTLFVNGFLGYAARYRIARALSRNGIVVVLDQGFFQLLISLGSISPLILKAFPRPDLLVVVETNSSLRQERMTSRGRIPREEFGPESYATWDRGAELALNETLPLLEDLVNVYRYDGTRDPEDGAAEIIALAKKRKTYEASLTRNLLKTVLAAISFLVAQAVNFFRRNQQVVVLMYHSIDRSGWKLSVTPEMFERQMRYLAQKGWAVSLQDVVAYANGEKKLSAHAVAVTFDDGYRDLLTTVLPVITKHRIPITIFVPSDVSVRSGERAKHDICTWEEFRVLQHTGIVSIESHSRTHAHLSRLSSHQLAEEMKGSADDIERELGIRPRYHAYPYGERSFAIEEEAAKAYSAAFGITEGLIRRGDNLFRLKRVQIDSTMNFLLFRLRLTSAVEWNRCIVDTLRHRR